MPSGTDVTTLAPTFTLSSGTCDRESGTGTYTFTGGPLPGGDLTVSGSGTLSLFAADTYTGPISGTGTVRRDLGGGINQSVNYDLNAFTGTLELSNGMAAVLPFYSPSFVSPTSGTIKVEDNTTLYFGWNGYTLDTTVERYGTGENAAQLRGISSKKVRPCSTGQVSKNGI